MATSQNRSFFWPTWEENKPFALLLIILLAYAIVFLAMKMEQLGKPEPYEHQMTFEGEATVTASPDVATVTVAVDNTAEDVTSAQTSNSETMNLLLEKVKALGISADDIQTSYYNVYEATEWDGEAYVSIGWTVSNSITIKIRDNALVSSVLDTAGQNGATSISGPSFELEDTDSLKERARVLAIADAQEKALTLSQTLGVELDTVVGYSEWTDSSDPYMLRSYAESAYGGSTSSPEIEAGSEEMTLRVSITYRLEE
ncbi:MAG: SIMPL domain-containing protein [Patescibacteria group bacterium]